MPFSSLVLSDVLQQLVDLMDQLAGVHTALMPALTALAALMEGAIKVIFLVILWDFLHGW